MSGKDSFWFKHDSNARNDIKVVRLRMKHGWAGYGAFFALIECLREERQNRITIDDMDVLLQNMHIEAQIFESIVSAGLLKIAQGYVFSESLDSRMKDWNRLTKKRREAGKAGGSKPKKEAKAKQIASKTEAKSKQTASDVIRCDGIGLDVMEGTGLKESHEGLPLPLQGIGSPEIEVELFDVSESEALPEKHVPKTTAIEKPKKATASKGGAVWDAYSAAYEKRYGVAPVRNMRSNTACAQLVDRLGATEAPSVAEWYLGSRNAFYSQTGHSLGMLVKDAEKIRTEWASGREISRIQAIEQERLDEAGESWKRVIERRAKKNECKIDEENSSGV